jgi:hypothetical protein
LELCHASQLDAEALQALEQECHLFGDLRPKTRRQAAVLKAAE